MLSKIKGCFYGLAVGDALGFPIEFLSGELIKQKYGEQGITDYVSDGRIHRGMISDDTQMSIATAVGCISAFKEHGKDFSKYIIDSIYDSYKEWVFTQDDSHNRRAPGNTCLSALKLTEMGTLENPLNDSKGCGAVMRSAPIGLLFSPEKAFELGILSGVITHGHPGGYLPAGFLSALISYLTKGERLSLAVQKSFDMMQGYAGHERVDKDAFLKAFRFANGWESVNDEVNIQLIGEGWLGDEALAIALYCALRYPDNYEKAVLTACNHKGDSDTTGCITGAIMGTLLGVEAIPINWRKKNEVKSSLSILSDQFHNIIFSTRK